MTKDLPHVTRIIDMLDKPWLVPWATGLGVEYMQEKGFEIFISPINKILNEIEDMQLLKGQEIKNKLKTIRDEGNKNFMGDKSDIAKEAKMQHKKRADEAADRGKRGHSAIETFLQSDDGAQISVDEDIAKPFRKFVDWWILNDVEVVEVECPVWNEDGGGYKGKFDLAANIKREGKKNLYLIDFKFTPRIYDDVKLQLAAYFYGWKERTNYIPDRAAVLRLDFTDGPEEWKEILESELYVHYQKFIRLVELWHLMND